MSSPMPSADNDYLVGPETRLDVATLNAIFGSIADRLRAQEAQVADYEAAIEQLTANGLTMIAENVAPQLADARAQLIALQAAAEVLADEIAFIRAGGIDAVNVKIAPIAGFEHNNAQGAFVAMAEQAENISQLRANVDGLAEYVGEPPISLQALLESRNQAGGFAGLDGSGKLAPAVVPASIAFSAGDIRRSLVNPGAGWLALDGSKYLRSAYPAIAAQVGAPFSGATQRGLGGPSGDTSIVSAVQTANYILVTTTGNKVYRIPRSATSGGAAFVECLGTALAGNSASYMRLFKTSTGRVFVTRGTTTSVNGSYRYTDDEGATWSASYVFPFSSAVNYVINAIEQVAAKTYLLLSNGAMYVSTSYTTPWTYVSSMQSGYVRIGDIIYHAQGANISALDLVSGGPSVLFGTIAGESLTAAAYHRGALHLFGATVNGRAPVYRMSIASSKWTKVGEIEVPSGYEIRSASGVVSAGGATTLLVGMRGTASPYYLRVVAFDDNLTMLARLGDFQTPTNSSIAQAPDVVGDVLTWHPGDGGAGFATLAKYELDINVDTEFRLPVLPDHYVRAA